MESGRESLFPIRETNKLLHSEIIGGTNVTELTTNNNNNEIYLHDHDDNGNQTTKEFKEEDVHLGDTSNYTPEERNALYQRGLEYESDFKPSAALQCYLGCIQGLTNQNMFAHLPQCLRKIADIHSSKENYDRAVQFAQAEKLFYEATQWDADEIQQKIDEIAGDNWIRPTDLSELNIEALRAEEYEHLAKLCWLKQQHQLALEYAGRCVKLGQQIYGDNHEKTKLSLNLFTAVYAEVRKLQSSGELDNDNDLTGSTPKTPEIIMSSPVGRSPVSILRQRSEDGSKEIERERKQVRFHESVDENLRLREKEDYTSISMTLLQLAVCIVILASMVMWLYCSLDKSQSCQSLITQFQNWVRTIQHYYRTFFSHRRPS